VEVYSPGYHCELPSLPDMRYGHTNDGATLCGGEKTRSSCITFSSGKWVTSHALAEERRYHTSWNNKEEGKIILMGGYSGSASTAETIKEGENDGVPGFTLKYTTTNACAINEGTTVIITGGTKTPNIVSRYGTAGHIVDLPSLNQGRHGHGCGSYTDDSGEQVFLVAGGSYISTEMLTSTSSAWVMVKSLPRKVTTVGSVTLGNIIYITGGIVGGSIRDEIYKWTGQEWEEVGKMKKARYYHAVSTITLNEIKDFCT